MNKLQTLAAKVLGFQPTTERAPAPAPRAEVANVGTTATAKDIQQALRSGEKGDTKQLFAILRDYVLSDEHVQSCLNTRKLAVIGQPLSILPMDKTNADDVAAAAACRRFVADCDRWNASLSGILDSIFWPVSVAERIARPADAPVGDEPRLQYTLRSLDQVEYAQLCFKWAYQSGAKIDPTAFEPRMKLWPLDADGLIQYDMAGAQALDRNRHIVHRGHLLSFPDNHGGPARCILGWALLRQLGRDWFGRFMERYGSPFVKAKTDSTDSQKVSFLQEAFSAASKVFGLVIDHEDEAELVQAVVQGGAEGHKIWHDVCNNAISRAITGYDSATTPGGLNAGQSDKSENVRDDYRMLDVMLLAETLEKQVFKPLLEINGLLGRIKVSFGGLSQADAKGFADMVKTMKEAGWELGDDSIPTANERTGLTWQRAAAAAPANNGMDAAAQLATFAAMLPRGVTLPRVTHPSDAVAGDHAKAVGDAMREAFKPALQIIQDSKTAAECEARLAALFADWRPKQFVAALEKPLQICAAKGAVDAKKS